MLFLLLFTGVYKTFVLLFDIDLTVQLILKVSNQKFRRASIHFGLKFGILLLQSFPTREPHRERVANCHMTRSPLIGPGIKLRRAIVGV